MTLAKKRFALMKNKRDSSKYNSTNFCTDELKFILGI